MKTKLPDRTSEADFLSWPESMSKIELLDGDVVASPAPRYGHQEILRRMVLALGNWALGRRVTVGLSPCDIRFGPGRILQPDAFVVLDRIPLATTGPLTRIPEICIEILSRDATYDRTTKRLVYAAAGVREFWAVDLAGTIERWTGEGLVEAETITDVLVTPLLDGFELDVPAFFAEARVASGANRGGNAMTIARVVGATDWPGWHEPAMAALNACSRRPRRT